MKEDLTLKVVDSGDTNRPILKPILLLKLSFLLVSGSAPPERAHSFLSLALSRRGPRPHSYWKTA